MPWFGNRSTATWRDYHALPKHEREELHELVEAHGFTHTDVYAVEYDIIDAPMLTIRWYAKNDEGRCYVDTDGDIAKGSTDVLLRRPLPSFWPADA